MSEENDEIQRQKIRTALYDILKGVDFTATERKIVQRLADGEKHKVDEMSKILDSQANRHNLAVHITNLRFKLLPIGHNIICETHKGIPYYRYVILLSYLVD